MCIRDRGNCFFLGPPWLSIDKRLFSVTFPFIFGSTRPHDERSDSQQLRLWQLTALVANRTTSHLDVPGSSFHVWILQVAPIHRSFECWPICRCSKSSRRLPPIESCFNIRGITFFLWPTAPWTKNSYPNHCIVGISNHYDFLRDYYSYF